MQDVLMLSKIMKRKKVKSLKASVQTCWEKLFYMLYIYIYIYIYAVVINESPSSENKDRYCPNVSLNLNC